MNETFGGYIKKLRVYNKFTLIQLAVYLGIGRGALSKIENINSFNEKLSDYLFWYNAKRPHYSLGQKPPIEYIKMNENNYGKKYNMYWMHTMRLLVSK